MHELFWRPEKELLHQSMGSHKTIYSRYQMIPTNKTLYHQSGFNCCQFSWKAWAMRRTELCAIWNLETQGSITWVAGQTYLSQSGWILDNENHVSFEQEKWRQACLARCRYSEWDLDATVKAQTVLRFITLWALFNVLDPEVVWNSIVSP